MVANILSPYRAGGPRGKSTWPAPVLDRISPKGEARVSIKPVGLSAGISGLNSKGPNIGAAKLEFHVADYFYRVYAVPSLLSLVDPDDTGTFVFLYNTNYTSATISGVSGFNTSGITTSFAVSTIIKGFTIQKGTLTVSSVIVSDTSGQFNFTLTGSQVPLAALKFSIVKANLIKIPPERPVNEKLIWKTQILTAEPGNEQRIQVRSLPRKELSLKFNVQEDADRQKLYEVFLKTAKNGASIPLWWERLNLLSDTILGQSTVQIQHSLNDIKKGDTLFFAQGVSTFISRIVDLNLDGATVELGSQFTEVFSKNCEVYRTQQILLPETPSIKQGAYAHDDVDVVFRSNQFRRLFYADASLIPLTSDKVFPDRVLDRNLYTLAGIPVLNARPIMDDSIDQSFDWAFRVTDFETGVITQRTNRSAAEVSQDRRYLVRTLDQRFYWNRVLDWCQGQRKTFWLPTWMNELDEYECSYSSSSILIEGEKFANLYPDSSSHRGLWFKAKDVFFGRKIISVAKNGLGQTLVNFALGFPSTIVPEDIQNVGLMLLARLGSDEVQFEHRGLDAFLTFTTKSTTSSGDLA